MAIRITGGIWRGRRLDVPRTGVRPTQDRVRAAVFSSLQSIVPGAAVLDLFAGTGAFGLEALSRGASLACFVEQDPTALTCLERNVFRLAAGPAAQIARSEALRFINDYAGKQPFDIVFADPPYDSAGELLKKILSQVSNRNILKAKGFLILEARAKTPLLAAGSWNIYWQRNYGETRICIYKFKELIMP